MCVLFFDSFRCFQCLQVPLFCFPRNFESFVTSVASTWFDSEKSLSCFFFYLRCVYLKHPCRLFSRQWDLVFSRVNTRFECSLERRATLVLKAGRGCFIHGRSHGSRGCNDHIMILSEMFFLLCDDQRFSLSLRKKLSRCFLFAVLMPLFVIRLWFWGTLCPFFESQDTRRLFKSQVTLKFSRRSLWEKKHQRVTHEDEDHDLLVNLVMFVLDTQIEDDDENHQESGAP